MADRLKPCPFCGGEAEIREIFVTGFHNVLFIAKCRNIGCGAIGSECVKKETAIEKWNHRSSPWHTGTPTEEGYYLCHVQFNSEDYESDEEGYDLPYWFKDGSWGDESVRVIAWRKIEPYKED